MGTGTSREALMGAIQETDERAQVSIGLLSYMNHLTCPIWALNLTTMRMRQQSKFDLTMELVSPKHCAHSSPFGVYCDLILLDFVHFSVT